MSYDELDPGIRETVRWLRDRGFDTTDSGDGVSKPEDERALDVPHVFMRCQNGAAAVFEALRLRLLLDEAGLKVGPGVIAASFDPVDGSAILSLVGVSDGALAPRTTSDRNQEP